MHRLGLILTSIFPSHIPTHAPPLQAHSPIPPTTNPPAADTVRPIQAFLLLMDATIPWTGPLQLFRVARQCLRGHRTCAPRNAEDAFHPARHRCQVRPSHPMPVPPSPLHAMKMSKPLDPTRRLRLRPGWRRTVSTPHRSLRTRPWRPSFSPCQMGLAVWPIMDLFAKHRAILRSWTPEHCGSSEEQRSANECGLVRVGDSKHCKCKRFMTQDRQTSINDSYTMTTSAEEARIHGTHRKLLVLQCSAKHLIPHHLFIPVIHTPSVSLKFPILVLGIPNRLCASVCTISAARLSVPIKGPELPSSIDYSCHIYTEGETQYKVR